MTFNSISSRLLVCSALTTVTLAGNPVMAQSSVDDDGLEVIVVTAQKRAQSVQDVPIAVTAISGETLQANRITNVVDLSGIAPGVTARTAVGGTGLPIFAVRGQLSYGSVPGSDKQVSLYLDGVYISQGSGSIFDLPAVERIEVLRGPQGTLFGRNATAGAISISTRDPAGEPRVTASATVGNQNEYRWQLSAATPEMGPFSAYFSYLHAERRGDIRNLQAGMRWDRRGSNLPGFAKIATSPEWLGSKDVDSYFASLKFETGDFRTVYKFDYAEANNTPEGTATVALNRGFGGGLFGGYLGALLDSNGVTVEPADGSRPKGVHNGWAIPSEQLNFGHSLTSTWIASDEITIKNIAAYRKNRVYATSSIDGFSALPLTAGAVPALATLTAFSIFPPANAPAAIPGLITQLSGLIGQPYVGVASQATITSRQWSDELQATYISPLLTATVGGLYFHSKDIAANHWLPSTYSFTFLPGGVVPAGNVGQYNNEAKSIAAYAQVEVHVTPQIDIILGGRVTNDKKNGSFLYGTTQPPANIATFTYNDTRFTYLIGANYKPTQDIMLYAKYSTGYVSGGSVAGIPFEVETVKSAEAGIKSEWFDRKLRANLAVWWADVKNLQSPDSTTGYQGILDVISPGNPAIPFVGTFVTNTSDRTAKGFEFDFDAAPIRGVTVGGSLSYLHQTTKNVNPALLVKTQGVYTGWQNIPRWTASAYAQYDTPKLTGDTYLSLRADAIFTGKVETDANPNSTIFTVNNGQYADAYIVKGYWTVNGRIALKDLNIGGVKTELAAWGRNLFDAQRFSYALNLSNILIGSNYIPARSYGLDLTISF